MSAPFPAYANILLIALLFSPLPSFCELTPPISSSLSSSVRQCKRTRGRVRACGGFCAYRMCNINGSIFQLDVAPFTLLGLPRVAPLPFVCQLATQRVTTVVQTGEARVFDTDHFVPISQWRPPGLSHPFPAGFLATFEVPFFQVSGVARSAKTKGNQWRYLHDRCWVMPVLKYNAREGGEEVGKDTVGELDNCVAFRTTAPELNMQLNWEGADDFDVLVEEPDGEIVDFFETRSKNGKLNGDNSRSLCANGLPAGKENVVYFPGNAESGEYIVEVKHFKTCTSAPVAWVLRVLKNGVLLKIWKGLSKIGAETLILKQKFKFTGSNPNPC